MAVAETLFLDRINNIPYNAIYTDILTVPQRAGCAHARIGQGVLTMRKRHTKVDVTAERLAKSMIVRGAIVGSEIAYTTYELSKLAGYKTEGYAIYNVMRYLSDAGLVECREGIGLTSRRAYYWQVVPDQRLRSRWPGLYELAHAWLRLRAKGNRNE